MSAPETLTQLTVAAGRTRTYLRCRIVRALLPGELLDTWPLSWANRRHLESCLMCQVHSARYRATLRALRLLRDETEDAPESLVARVVAQLDTSTPRRRAYPARVVVLSAVAASAAAAAAVVVLRWTRSSPV
jgi:anti-sigma factor RsiW